MCAIHIVYAITPYNIPTPVNKYSCNTYPFELFYLMLAIFGHQFQRTCNHMHLRPPATTCICTCSHLQPPAPAPTCNHLHLHPPATTYTCTHPQPPAPAPTCNHMTLQPPATTRHTPPSLPIQQPVPQDHIHSTGIFSSLSCSLGP